MKYCFRKTPNPNLHNLIDWYVVIEQKISNLEYTYYYISVDGTRWEFDIHSFIKKVVDEVGGPAKKSFHIVPRTVIKEEVFDIFGISPLTWYTIDNPSWVEEVIASNY